MAKKKKTMTAVNVIAFQIMEAATSQPHDLLHNGLSTSEDSNPDEKKPVKNSAAVALGRLSGLKGGKARGKNSRSRRGASSRKGLLRPGGGATKRKRPYVADTLEHLRSI
jgi:hypothetical protein